MDELVVLTEGMDIVTSMDTIKKLIKTSPWMIDGLNIQTMELVEIALDSNVGVFPLIKDHTPEMIDRVLRESSGLIVNVDNPTEHQFLIALADDGLLLVNVPADQQSEIIISTAIRQNADAIFHVSFPKEGHCIQALKRDPMTLRYIKDKTDNLCRIAYDLNSDSVIYASPEFRMSVLNKGKDDGTK